MDKLDNLSLEQINGGIIKSIQQIKTVKAYNPSGYLIFRSQPVFDTKSELFHIPNGESLTVDISKRNGSYIRAAYNNVEGWVNENYIIF